MIKTKIMVVGRKFIRLSGGSKLYSKLTFHYRKMKIRHMVAHSFFRIMNSFHIEKKTSVAYGIHTCPIRLQNWIFAKKNEKLVFHLEVRCCSECISNNRIRHTKSKSKKKKHGESFHSQNINFNRYTERTTTRQHIILMLQGFFISNM